MLMCRSHWASVPPELKRAVNDAFVPAQCEPGNGVRPTKEWFRAAREAIRVAEGFPAPTDTDADDGGGT
jgi:hypothetical protein